MAGFDVRLKLVLDGYANFMREAGIVPSSSLSPPCGGSCSLLYTTTTGSRPWLQSVALCEGCVAAVS